MSQEITSILQSLAPHHRVPGKAQGASQPTAVEKPAASQSDLVSISNSARLLQLAEPKPGPIPAPRQEPSAVGMTNAPDESREQSASKRLTTQGNAHRPSPALANMMEAFLTTSDMKNFDVNSDLNADGTINFLDIAVLRDKETGADPVPSEPFKERFHNMTEAFLSSKGSDRFDAASDLNNDGMINFRDIAILGSEIPNS